MIYYIYIYSLIFIFGLRITLDDSFYSSKTLLVAVACGLKYNKTLRVINIDYEELSKSKLHLVSLLAAVVYNLRFVSETEESDEVPADDDSNIILFRSIKEKLLNEARAIWKPFKGLKNSDLIDGILQVFTKNMVEGLSHETISGLQKELDKQSFRLFIEICKSRHSGKKG